MQPIIKVRIRNGIPSCSPINQWVPKARLDEFHRRRVGVAFDGGKLTVKEVDVVLECDWTSAFVPCAGSYYGCVELRDISAAGIEKRKGTNIVIQGRNVRRVSRDSGVGAVCCCVDVLRSDAGSSCYTSGVTPEVVCSVGYLENAIVGLVII